MFYVLIIAGAIIFWLFIMDRPVLKMTFKDGELVSHKGNLPTGFASNCREIGKREPFSGSIKVYGARAGAKIAFSKQIPNKTQQKIRNVFPHQGIKSNGGRKA